MLRNEQDKKLRDAARKQKEEGEQNGEEKKYPEAIRDFKCAIQSLEQITHKETEDFQELADVWNNLGIIYRDEGDVGPAITAFEKAIGSCLQIFVENSEENDTKFSNLATFYESVGELYQQEKKINKMIEAYRSSIFYCQQINKKDAEDKERLNRLSVYTQGEYTKLALQVMDKDIDLAIQYFRTQLKIYLAMPSHPQKGLLLVQARQFLAYAITKQGLQQEANAYGFTVGDIPGDGNCFFTALADQLTRQSIPGYAGKHQLYYRQQAVTAVQNHIKYYSSYIYDHSPMDHINNLAQDRTWADHLDILALARELNITIVIINSDKSAPHVIKRPGAVATVYLGFETNREYESFNHYQSLHPSLAAHSKDIQAVIDSAPFDDWELEQDYVIREARNRSSEKTATVDEEFKEPAQDYIVREASGMATKAILSAIGTSRKRKEPSSTIEAVSDKPKKEGEQPSPLKISKLTCTQFANAGELSNASDLPIQPSADEQLNFIK